MTPPLGGATGAELLVPFVMAFMAAVLYLTFPHLRLGLYLDDQLMTQDIAEDRREAYVNCPNCGERNHATVTYCDNCSVPFADS